MALLSRNLDWHKYIIIRIYYNRNGAKSIKWLRFEDIGIEVLQYIEDLFGAKNNNILRSVWNEGIAIYWNGNKMQEYGLFVPGNRGKKNIKET